MPDPIKESSESITTKPDKSQVIQTSTGESSKSAATEVQKEVKQESSPEADEKALRASNAIKDAALDPEAKIDIESPELGPLPTFDDFKALKNGGEPFKTVKKDGEEVTKIVETKPKGDLKEAAAKPDTEIKGDKQPDKTWRDYTGFDEKEAELLKKTSGETFNWIRPKLLEARKLEEVIKNKDKEIADLRVGKVSVPDSYYEHPQGFVLTPDYNAASQNLNTAAFVLKHWQDQLVNIREGGEWKDLDIRDGKPVYSTPQKADAKAEGQVLSYINWASTQANTHQSKLLELQNNFSRRHQEAVGAIRQAEKQHFAAYEDEKHPMQPVIKDLYAKMPAEFRNNPMTSIAVKASAAAIQYGHALRAEQTKVVELSKKLEEALKGAKPDTRTTPTDKDITTGGVSSGKGSREPEVTMDSFNALRNRA